MKFEELKLHDATILSISYIWEDKLLTVKGKYLSLERNEPVVFSLSFSAVTSTSFSHREEWGPSSSINGTKYTAPSMYCIEIQSGDVLKIEASGFKFSV